MRTSFTSPRRSPRRAFTLVEVLIAFGLFGLLSAGVIGSYLYSLNTFSYDLGRTLVNRDFRTFMNDMSDSVTYANQVRVYSEFETRSVYTDSSGNFSGNMIVCVYERLQSDGTNKIIRIIGFYRDSTGGIRRFESTPNVIATTDVLTLLPSAASKDSSSHHQQFPSCLGLNPGDKVFRNYNNNGTGVSVFAKLENPGRIQKKASNVIHFTAVRRS